MNSKEEKELFRIFRKFEIDLPNAEIRKWKEEEKFEKKNVRKYYISKFDLKFKFSILNLKARKRKSIFSNIWILNSNVRKRRKEMAGISRRSKTLYWLDLPKFDSPLNLKEERLSKMLHVWKLARDGKSFEKVEEKREWKVEVWEEIRVLCRSNWTNLTRNNVALEIKKRRFKAYWPPSASKRAGDLELLEQTFCTVFLHRLCRMCERGGESHYGIVQEELKRKGKKKKEKDHVKF